ncbi:MAG: ABC transporter substrate-binding protein [Candidatus Thorarchaeota archaeon]
MRKVGAIGICLLFILFPFIISSDAFLISDEPLSLLTGPYIDKIVMKYRGYPHSEALKSGSIDIEGEACDVASLDGLPAEVSAYFGQSSKYYLIYINCEKYPLNITGFRRAFAYAFNKTQADYPLLNYLTTEHDSLLPLSSVFCIEDELPYHYYIGEIELANAMLDQLNFTIDSETGYRLKSNGESFDIIVGYSFEGTGSIIAELAVETLNALHIDAEAKCQVYNDGRNWLAEGLYHMWSWYSSPWYDVQELADEFWSENAESEETNLCRFQNASFDSWRAQFLTATSYDDIQEAATEMQLILHFNVPQLAICQSLVPQLYRTDKFEGHISELTTISGQWTMRNIYQIGGGTGGTLNIGYNLVPENFNIFLPQYRSTIDAFNLLYSSLYDYGPNREIIPDLVSSMLHETHDDNPTVPAGHTKYTIDIIQNATWSDGTPLTATDVAFTFTYEQLSASYGNPAGTNLDSLVSALAPTPSRVILEFDTDSYWLFTKFAFNHIIPEHIFNDDYGIGYEAWAEWNPVIDPDEPHLTSGPFRVSDFDEGEYLELTYNPSFYYIPERTEPTSGASTTVETSTTTSTNSTITHLEDPLYFSLPFLLVISISTISAVVIIYCTIRIHQRRSSGTST